VRAPRAGVGRGGGAVSRGPVSVALPAALWGRLGLTEAHRRAALEGLLTWYLALPLAGRADLVRGAWEGDADPYAPGGRAVSAETFAALGTMLGLLVGGLASAVVLILNARSANRQKEEAAAAALKEQEQAGAVGRLERIVERQERDIARREAHDGEQQAVIRRLQELHAQSRERYADLRGRYELVYGYARRQAETMRKAGLTPEPAADLPPPPPAPAADADAGEVRFLVAQTEQSSAVLRSLAPPAAAGAHEAGESTGPARATPGDLPGAPPMSGGAPHA
jgi:hypothetical protein